MDCTEYRPGHTHAEDRLGNVVAHEGCDRCVCGCKYYENDQCIDCGLTPERAWIRMYAASARTAADVVTTWEVDRLKIHVGMARVLERGEEHGTPSRMVPTGGGMCVLVVDN